LHFHNRTDLPHQDADAAQQDPRPKPGPHQRADGQVSFLESRVDEYLTVAMAIHSVVHTREEWIAGVVPERVYTRDVGITVLRNMLAVNLLRVKTPGVFPAITEARLVTVGP
jgi:hypothetical protein